MKSSSKQVIPANKHSPRQSLCLSCSLAYGHLCFSVPFTDRDWVLAYGELEYAGSHEPYIIRLVVECRRYQYSRGRRVPLVADVRCRR
jgi:hypothetical protein